MSAPPPPPWAPGPPVRHRSLPLLLLGIACWCGFVVCLVPLLFVWVAVGDGHDGTGWAWPITGVTVVVLVAAVLLTRSSERITARR